MNAYQRYNGDSNLALSYTLGINKGDYANTNSQAFTTFKSASAPKLNDFRKAGLIYTPKNARTLTEVYTASGVGLSECWAYCGQCGNQNPSCCPHNTSCGNCVNGVRQCTPN